MLFADNVTASVVQFLEQLGFCAENVNGKTTVLDAGLVASAVASALVEMETEYAEVQCEDRQKETYAFIN